MQILWAIFFSTCFVVKIIRNSFRKIGATKANTQKRQKNKSLIHKDRQALFVFMYLVLIFTPYVTNYEEYLLFTLK